MRVCRVVPAAIILAFAGYGCSGSTSPEEIVPQAVAVISVDAVTAVPSQAVSVGIRIADGDLTDTGLDSARHIQIGVAYDGSHLVLDEIRRGNAVWDWDRFEWEELTPYTPHGPTLATIFLTRTIDSNGVWPGPVAPQGDLAWLRFVPRLREGQPRTCIPIEFSFGACLDNTITAGSDGNILYAPDRAFGLTPGTNSVFDTLRCPMAHEIRESLEFRSGEVCMEWPSTIMPCDVDFSGYIDSEDISRLIDFLFFGTTSGDTLLDRMRTTASDCNRDGEEMTVADFDYLVNSVFFGSSMDTVNLPPAYSDTVTITARLVGDTMMVSASSEAPTSAIWVVVRDRNGGGFSTEYINGSLKHSDWTGEGWVMFHRVSSEPAGNGWPPTVRVYGNENSDFEIVKAQASRPPGVPMAVRIEQ